MSGSNLVIWLPAVVFFVCLDLLYKKWSDERCEIAVVVDGSTIN